MTIRSRLFALLLPSMTLFVLLIALFFFYNWKSEITDSFREDLKSIVVTTADLLDANEMSWILEHKNDPTLKSSPIYRKNWEKLKELQKKLPVDNLYVVAIEPVKVGEPVILDEPVSETNQLFDGKNPEYSYRQVYLIDTEKDPEKTPYYDFSESNEQVLYKDPKAFATSIYEAKGTNDLYMSGYAPLFNSKRQVYALVGSNLNLDIFNHMIHRAVLLIVGASIVSLILVGSVVYLITNKISEPVQKLKEAALSLAAGEYEEKISVSGPKEIVDLANTYNTMRECLLENINRLRDISYSREVLFGEQECALLLQHRMLDVVIEQFHDPRLAIKHIASSSSTLGYGAKLLIDQGKDHINLTFQQSQEEGFEGIYHLLSGVNGNFSQADLDFNFTEKQLDVRTQSMPLPIFWSLQQMRFLPDGDKHSFASGDLVLLYNQELEDAFPSRAAIKEWLNRVFRQFGKDPMALMATMLGSELNFWQKKQPTTRNVHLYLIKT